MAQTGKDRLTVKAIENAKPRKKNYKLYDGGGLQVVVSPSGGKWFRLKYKFNGREKQISLGVFPSVSLKEARDDRDGKRKLLSQGIDPSLDRKAKKLAQAQAADDTFESIAREFLDKKKYPDSTVEDRFEKYAFPAIGAFPIAEIKPAQVLAVVQPIDNLGKHETAHRVLSACGQVFRYGVATGRLAFDPTRDLRGALASPDAGNFAAITEPEQVGPLLRMIDGYDGTLAVCCALRLAPLVFVRPGELRNANWADFDLDKAEWRFVLSKRKRGGPKRDLIVPLSRQALEILRPLQAITGTSNFVFPSMRKGSGRPLSDGTINAALRSMGIPKEEMCAHGFRAMARTILAEVLHIPSEIIELQLGHAVKDANGTAYNRTSFLPERRDMMQQWADYLEGLKATIMQ
jgi:integrase